MMYIMFAYLSYRVCFCDFFMCGVFRKKTELNVKIELYLAVQFLSTYTLR